MKYTLKKVTVGLIYFFILLGNKPGWGEDDPLKPLITYAEEHKIETNLQFQRYLEQGLLFWKRGEYSNSAEAFGEAAMASPYHPLPNLYFALSLLGMKEYQLAGQVLRRAVALYPYWEKLAFDITLIFPTKSAFYKMLEEMERWAFAEPRDCEIYFLLGFLYQYSGTPQKAASLYQLILTKLSSHDEAKRLLMSITGEKEKTTGDQITSKKARQSFLQGDYENAADLFAMAYMETGDSGYLYSLTHAFFALQNYKLASATLSLALEQGKERLQEQKGLRERYGNPSMFDTQLHNLETMIQKNPENTSFLFLLSYLYTTLGEDVKAEMAIKTVLSTSPTHQGAKYLFSLLSKEKPPQQQNEPSTKDTDNDPLVSGKAYFKAENYKQALRSFAQACVQNPKRLESKQWLVLASFAVGEYHYAEKAFRQLLQLGGQGQGFTEWRSFYEKPGQFESHLSDLTRYVQTHPNEKECIFLLGAFLMSIKDYKRAQEIFAVVISLDSADEDAKYFQNVCKLQESK